jgi:hypothetical protein
VTAIVAVFVTLPEVYVLAMVTCWSLDTAAVVSTPPVISAYDEFSLHVAAADTFCVVPSENEAVAAYVAVLLSMTAAGPVTASPLRILGAVPLSHVDGAPDTARSTLPVECAARTRHGTRARFSKTALQRPLFSTFAVPSAAPVAAFSIVTDGPLGAVPDT